MKIKHERHGVDLGSFEIVALCGDPKAGDVILLRAKRQQVAIRITPGGQLRVGPVGKAGSVRAKGVQ